MRQRPLGDDDRDALLALYHEAEDAEDGAAFSTMADIRSLLAAPGLDAAHTSVLLADDGALVGFVALHPAPQTGLSRAQLVVAPEDATAHATALLRVLDSWLDGPADVSMYQLPGALATDALVAGGWEIVHSSTRLIVDLDAPAGPFTAKPGIRVRVAETDADRRLVHAILEGAVAHDWNHRHREFARFEADQVARDGYDPALWLLAELDGAPAGVLIGRDPQDRSWIAWLGVAEQARGRGLAQALLHTVFDTFRARDRHRVGVDTDTHNATDAVKVYERAGMVSQGTADQWRRVYSG